MSAGLHRIGARVSGLSPAQLCAIIEAQAGASDAALRVAEEHATRLVEQPEWVLSKVLLSPDLAPHILAQLPTKEHAVKGTCRAWRRGWKITLAKRGPRLLVVGGSGSDVSGTLVSSVERYDPSANAWEAEAVALVPTARQAVALALLDGKLYAVGGGGWSPSFSYSPLVERYDLATKSWEAAAPMGTGRMNHAVAVLNGRLYVVGGNDGPALSSVERYDPALDAWEAVAPMASARMSPGAAVLDGKLYAVGGAYEEDLSSVERYDPATNAWEAVAPLAPARFQASVAALDGKLYAVGGTRIYAESDPDYLTSVERYDPGLNAWEMVAPIAEARSRAGVAVLDGKLYVVGGITAEQVFRGDGALSSVERYDPATNAWEAVAPMARGRHRPVVALLSSSEAAARHAALSSTRPER